MSMTIDRVKLWNFRSYDRVDVRFSEGTTAVLGKNEAGKTSLFLAIGFALFDYRAGTLVQCLREETAEGMVSVKITLHGSNEYWVTRKFTATTTTSWEVHEASESGGMGEHCLASGTKNVRRWLQEQLGIDPELGLKTLFERVVGVPQGTDTAPFTLSPGARADVFGRLLKSQEYQKASDGLRSAERSLTEQVHELETAIAKAEGELAVLPRLEVERHGLLATISTLGATIEPLQEIVTSTQGRVLGMEELRETAKKAQARADKSQVRADTHRSQVTAAQQAVEEAEKAAAIVKQNTPACQEYELVATKLKELEQAEKEYSALLAKQGRLQTQVARAEQAQVRADEIEEELEQFRQRETELEQARIRLAELKVTLAELDKMIKARREQLSTHSRTAEVAAAENTRLKDQSNWLLTPTVEDTLCPTCGTVLTQENKDDILERNTREAGVASFRASKARIRATKCRGEIDQLCTRGSRVKESMAALPSADQLPRVRKNLTKLTTARDTLKETLVTAAENTATLGQIAAALFIDFGTLSVELHDFKARRRASENGWLAYTRNQAQAQRLPGYLDKLRETRDAQEVMDRDALQILGEARLAQKAYNAEEHNRVMAEGLALQKDLTTARTQLEEKQAHVETVENQIAALQEVATQLDQTRHMLKDTNTDHSVVRRVRKVLREAGPLITQQQVERVSQRTASIYRDLTGSSEGYLQWTQDFGLVLRIGERERAFSQFSGGQQMSAALAWRLAILLEISGVGIIILDEPTAHVDPDRREYLATRIGQIREAQTFVVSHDPTFERITARCVRIIRDETGSRLDLST